MLGAYNESFAGSNEDVKRVRQDEEDEFDALVKSGETMKVSLTPSRLKTFEVSVRILEVVSMLLLTRQDGWQETGRYAREDIGNSTNAFRFRTIHD